MWNITCALVNYECNVRTGDDDDGTEKKPHTQMHVVRPSLHHRTSWGYFGWRSLGDAAETDGKKNTRDDDDSEIQALLRLGCVVSRLPDGVLGRFHVSNSTIWVRARRKQACYSARIIWAGLFPSSYLNHNVLVKLWCWNVRHLHLTSFFFVSIAIDFLCDAIIAHLLTHLHHPGIPYARHLFHIWWFPIQGREATTTLLCPIIAFVLECNRNGLQSSSHVGKMSVICGVDAEVEDCSNCRDKAPRRYGWER